MDKSVIIEMSSLGGVALGFMLNEIAGLIKQRRDDKRLLRRALFRLLDLHHFISPIKIKELSSMLYDWIHSKDPISAGKISPQELHDITQQILAISFAPIHKEALKNISDDYEKSIVDIAEINPILAFKLSGRSRIQTDISQYLKSAYSLFQNENQEDEIIAKNMLIATKEFYNDELYNTLGDDIKKVAKQISVFQRYKIYSLSQNNLYIFRISLQPAIRGFPTVYLFEKSKIVSTSYKTCIIHKVGFVIHLISNLK